MFLEQMSDKNTLLHPRFFNIWTDITNFKKCAVK